MLYFLFIYLFFPVQVCVVVSPSASLPLCDRTAQAGRGREPQTRLIASSTFLDTCKFLFIFVC